MTSILISAGFQYLETLNEFSLKWTKLRSSDDYFDSILICHKTKPSNMDINSYSNLDYTDLLCVFLKRIDSTSEQSVEWAKSIFRKIYSHFSSPLTAHIINNCFLFYKWKSNSIEVITDFNYVHEKIQEHEGEIIPLKWNTNEYHYKTELVNNCSQSLLKEHCQKSNTYDINFSKGIKPQKPVSSKKMKKITQNLSPVCDLAKNLSCPMQEVFSLGKILYDNKARPRWPRNHILSVKCVEKLFHFIINMKEKCSQKILNQLYETSSDWILYRVFLKEFLENHLKLEKNNGYGRILKKHMQKVPNTKGLLSAQPISMVSSYVVDVLRRVIPSQYYVNNNLRKKFFSSVVKIIKGRLGENFIWEPFLRGFIANKSRLIWCSEMTSDSLQHLMILKTFKFFIVHYVFDLIKNQFFVTETGTSGYELRFYTKSDMETRTREFLNRLIYYNRIKIHKKRDIESYTMERNWLDFGVIDGGELKRQSRVVMHSGTEFRQAIARLRFLPKFDAFRQEMRIITNFSNQLTTFVGPSYDTTKLQKMFEERRRMREEKLLHVKLFLKYLIEETAVGIEPVPGNPRLEKAWCKAVSMKNKCGNLYFVKADITDAFDSILHHKLLQVLKDRIREVIRSDREFVQLNEITEWRVKNGQLKRCKRLSYNEAPIENAILIRRSSPVSPEDKSFRCRITEFLDIVKQVALEQRVQVNGRIFKLVKGLAQGSAGRFSPSLCEIYYTSMDKEYFDDYLKSEDCILLRGVDDYLLITADLNKAKQFFRIVRSGIAPFNARFSAQKLKSNLFGDVQEVSYLGLKFNFEDMSVSPNYSKYQKVNMLSTMKLSDKYGNVHFNKSEFIKKRLTRLESLKLQPILLHWYNSSDKVRESIFLACLMQVVKTMILVDHIYPKGCHKNDLFIAKLLFKICNKLNKATACRKADFSREIVTWMFLEAAVITLKRKAGQFKTLLLIMRFHLFKWEKRFPDLKYIEDFNRTFDHKAVNNFLKSILNND